MKSDVQEKLKEILYNIELRINDLTLEKQGYKLKIYFDAYDIEFALKGFSSFYKANQFAPELFNSNKTLVHSLATSGNLAEIHVLPPHKAELFNRLKKLKNTFEDRPDMMAVKFLKDIDSELLSTSDSSSNIDFLFKNNFQEIINALILEPKKSENLFRAIQNLSPWFKRLQEVINEGRILLENIEENINYVRLIENDYFKSLKKVFNSIKNEDMDINNTTDALSISILIEKIERYKENDSAKEIPIFFASSNLIKIFTTGDISIYKPYIRQKILELKERLVFDKTSDGRSISVIRDESYFIYKAIFCPNETISNRKDQVDDLLKKLTSWREQIKEFLSVDFFKENTQNPMKTWLSDLDDRQKEFFFQDIWLKSKAPKDLYQAVDNVVKAYLEFKKHGQAELRARISQAIALTEAKISREVQDARMIVELSKRVEKDLNEVSRNLRKGIRNQQGTVEQKIFNTIPFVRYSFPSEFQNAITGQVSLLLDPSTVDIFGDWLLNGYAGLIDEINNSNDRSNINLENLIIISASLVASEAFAPLKHLLEKIDPSLPIPLKILLAELLLPTSNIEHSDKDKEQGYGRTKSIIKELENTYSTESNKKIKHSLCIGIAFIFYRWWKNKIGKSMWNLPDNEREKTILMVKDNQNYLEKSIYYAEQAYNLWTSTENTEPEELYALNLALYFMVRSDRDTIEDNKKIDKYANKLIEHGANNPEIWQFRYDDTLCFYYCKQAKLKARNKTEFRGFIKEAEFYLKKAKDVSSTDETIFVSERLLKSVKANSKYRVKTT